MIFDTHAHYDDPAFDADRHRLLSSLPEHGIEAVVNVASSMETVRSTLELTKAYPFLYGAVGIHPSETEELSEERLSYVEQASLENKVVAIGEIGLDYHWSKPDPAIQKHWFARQLQLAEKRNLPVIIHSRDAAKDTLDLIRREHGGKTGGVIHCFSYGKEIAREYLNMGFYLGIGGVITFSNAKRIKEVAAYMPLDRLVLETDCPYLAPSPYRGQRNSSLNLPLVTAAISQIRGIPVEEILETTCRNARTLYRLPSSQL